MAYGLDTLVDVSRQSVDGKVMKIAQVLAQTNDIVLDAPFYPTNQTMSMVATLATGEPSGTWKGLNEFVGAEKPSTEQISDGCGMLEAWSNIDCVQADMSGDKAKYLENKDKAFIGGLGKTQAATMIYGNTAINPKSFTGLAPRYNSTTTGRGKEQIIKAGGTGSDNTSIWLVQWGEDKVHGIYPKDLTAGLQHDFKGKVTLTDNYKHMDVYQTKYDWFTGIHIADYRSVVRCANIDVSDLLTAGDASDTSTNLMKHMSLMLDGLPDTNGNVCFYMNKTVMSMLRVKLMNKGNTFLSVSDWTRDDVLLRRGRLSFMGFPIGRVDQITNAEAAVI